ncbi:MAG TPA: hypothetical protein VKA07_14105 [Candidatus Sulfotelmatobacter sp.]|nr:hypothetical protein [Candidatus Sulfotelmatobacter sp.]
MKRILLGCILLAAPALLAAQTHNHQQGTIIRMRMTDCLGPQHGFISVMSGADKAERELCPEYVLVTDKVVYVISGKTADQLLPLAEVTRFRLQKNEMLIRVDDAPRESHFHIKAMALRPDWERMQMLAEEEARDAASRQLGPASLTEQR